MDKAVPHKLVKSFAERQAGAAGAAFTGGIACPQCGGNMTMVTNTIRLNGQVRRYRQCASPKCRHKFVTKERAGK